MTKYSRRSMQTEIIERRRKSINIYGKSMQIIEDHCTTKKTFENHRKIKENSAGRPDRRSMAIIRNSSKMDASQ